MRQTPQNVGIWGDYQFSLNSNSVEYFDSWVVFNGLNSYSEVTNTKKANTILITAETYDLQHYPKLFTEQFSHLITNQPQIIHPQKCNIHTGAPWFVNKSYDELVKIQEVLKTKLISIVTSDKLITDGHKLRFDFAHRLKDYFKDEIDLFGRGIVDFDDKWDVLAPYKYNICIENGEHQDYFTEKLNDCYLAYTFPIYHGCPNITDYYTKDSLYQININDFELSLRAIEKILKSPLHYEAHVESLRIARSKCLNDYNLFAIIANYLDQNGDFNELPVRVQLKSMRFAPQAILEKVQFKLKKWKL
jgi:hypothetical protein